MTQLEKGHPQCPHQANQWGYEGWAAFLALISLHFFPLLPDMLADFQCPLLSPASSLNCFMEWSINITFPRGTNSSSNSPWLIRRRIIVMTRVTDLGYYYMFVYAQFSPVPFFFFLNFLTIPRAMWDLSSLTRAEPVPSALEAPSLNLFHQQSPSWIYPDRSLYPLKIYTERLNTTHNFYSWVFQRQEFFWVDLQDKIPGAWLN